MATFNLGDYDTGSVTLTDLRDTLCTLWGYQDTVPDPNNPGGTMPNPVTKTQFLHNYVGAWIRHAYKEQKRQEARAAAETGLPDVPMN